jgi:hypothetical protein
MIVFVIIGSLAAIGALCWLLFMLAVFARFQHSSASARAFGRMRPAPAWSAPSSSAPLPPGWH